MTDLKTVAGAYERGEKMFRDMMSAKACAPFCVSEEYGGVRKRAFANRLACGDNTAYMLHLLKDEGMAGRINLIYADPPFFSGSGYQASVRLRSEKLGESKVIKAGVYDDSYEGGAEEYLSTLTARLFLMRELLSEDGSIWVHLDRHASHYVKLILDSVFGENNFVNEVIWTYKSGGAGGRSFARKHDNLLFYGKSKGYYFNQLKEKSYNRGYKPYRFKGVEEFCDDVGWYTMVNMKDVWNIDMVGRTSSERTGYATQKPKKLMERIIGSCSREGDICADFFSGSGTMGAVCEEMGRSWIMCDSGDVSAAYQIERLGGAGAAFSFERPENTEAAGHGDDAAEHDAVGGGHDGAARECGEVGYTIDGGELSLTDYEPGMEGRRVIAECTDVKTLPEAEKYLNGDSLSLIKCWSVDTAYNGEVHRADRVMTGETTACGLDSGSAGNIGVLGYDVFGNRFTGIYRP